MALFVSHMAALSIFGLRLKEIIVLGFADNQWVNPKSAIFSWGYNPRIF